MYAIVGLGNVGEEYKYTRHNAGFMVIDLLSERWSIPLKKVKYSSFLGRGKVKTEEVVLAKPLTFMNLSGKAVKPLLDALKIPVSHLIVVHDDLDIPVGRIKIKVGGGAGGHKGVASILSFIDPEFIRVKIGIDKPQSIDKTVDYVLSRFGKEEEPIIKQSIIYAADAIELIMFKGVEKAQTIYNIHEA